MSSIGKAQRRAVRYRLCYPTSYWMIWTRNFPGAVTSTAVMRMIVIPMFAARKRQNE